MIKYDDCLQVIEKIRFNQESSLFAVERDKGLESIIGNIYQSFAGQDIYKSIEEKGANFLYLIVKIMYLLMVIRELQRLYSYIS